MERPAESHAGGFRAVEWGAESYGRGYKVVEWGVESYVGEYKAVEWGVESYVGEYKAVEWGVESYALGHKEVELGVESYGRGYKACQRLKAPQAPSFTKAPLITNTIEACPQCHWDARLTKCLLPTRLLCHMLGQEAFGNLSSPCFRGRGHVGSVDGYGVIDGGGL